MSATYKAQFPNQNKTKLALPVTIGLHLVAGWALLHATGYSVIPLLENNQQLEIIREVTLTKPPQPAATKPKAPPPPYIPPSEVAVASAPALEVVAVAAPAVSLPPPAPASNSPAPQQSEPAVAAPPAPDKVDMALACPGQELPEFPRKALIEKIQGMVVAQAIIEAGKVREGKILSGPKIYHDNVKNAMLRYRCNMLNHTVQAIKEFNFRVE